MQTTVPMNDLLSEVREGLRRLYGTNLRQLILYGSCARRQMEAGSDIDLMLVLEDFESSEAELARIDSIASELSLKHDVVLSFLVIRSREYLQRNTPLLLNIRREGLPV